MELEELKNRWSSLEEQLKKQEILNEKLIQEIRQTKSGPLNVLINYTCIGIILCILVIPLLIYVYTNSYFALFKTTIFAMGGILMVVGIITGIYNVLQLKKIDFTQSVNKNIQLAHTYKVNVKKQSIYTYIFVVIILLMAVIAGIMSPNMETWRWACTGAAIPLSTVLAYLEYKKIHKAKTNAILKSLEELKELEEE